MKNLAILGITGSIGRQTLNLIDNNANYKLLAGACTGQDITLTLNIIDQYKPKYFYIDNIQQRSIIQDTRPDIIFVETLSDLAQLKEATHIVVAVNNTSGIQPVLTAIRNNKHIAIANKESLISAGDLINAELVQYPKATLISADSEHVAMHQCLTRCGFDINKVRRIILTASGGPFYKNIDTIDISRITPEQALQHPTWSMGQKITIDSATLMNKGFEVIETHYLFNIPYDSIEVVIHPQSIIHSLVEFIDGSILAQMSLNNMELALQYALEYPNIIPNISNKYLNLYELQELNFYKPNKKFQCLEYAYKAGKLGGGYPSKLVEADEIAVYKFLNKQIKFNEIMEYIEQSVF